MSRSVRPRRFGRVAAFVGAVTLGAALVAPGTAFAEAGASQRYIVVFGGTYALDGSYALGGDYALNHAYALSIVQSAGGTVVSDLSRQIGVMVVDSADSGFYALVKNYALVEEVGRDASFQGVMAADPVPVADPLEGEQWNMTMIRAPEGQAIQAGDRRVVVGVLDTGIDGLHVDFQDDLGNPSSSNVDCDRGFDFTSDNDPADPSIGNGLGPCADNNFHGTHVAGIIAAQVNNHGVVGVAPGVTLVPVKVCDADGHCYFSDVLDGITYAGDQRFSVINMSFFVDDDTFQQSTEFKCMDDETQRAFRRGIERAIQYARKQDVVPVAALGNSDQDLADPSGTQANGDPIGNECETVPAESAGVVGTMALGRQSQKASYSNYGDGATDVAAPGGTSTATQNGVLSTIPGNAWANFSGTSMASPHAAGVAALIVSQFGKVEADGTKRLSPTKVEAWLQNTAIDIGLAGYDECFGNGRIDALRAVQKDTAKAYDGSAPFCPEYTE